MVCTLSGRRDYDAYLSDVSLGILQRGSKVHNEVHVLIFLVIGHRYNLIVNKLAVTVDGKDKRESTQHVRGKIQP